MVMLTVVFALLAFMSSSASSVDAKAIPGAPDIGDVLVLAEFDFGVGADGAEQLTPIGRRSAARSWSATEPTAPPRAATEVPSRPSRAAAEQEGAGGRRGSWSSA